VVNVRAIANRATSAINPNVLTSVQKCVGYSSGAGYHRTPDYAPAVPAVLQIQALTVKDLQHLDSMNIQGAEHAVYGNIVLTPVDRASQTGGDLVEFTNPATGVRNVWLVAAVLEGWSTAGWGRYALVKQTDTPSG